MMEPLQRLSKRLGYTFSRVDLLEQALRHRSVRGANNERLEFLGDAVLNLVIATELYLRFPAASEGELSCLRANLVNKDSLAELAQQFDLGDYVLLGAGELKSGGKQRHSILADTMEAIIGAIYLDAGIVPSSERILAWYHAKLATTHTDSLYKDAKTRLQEYLQAKHVALPKYVVILVEGAEHQQRFHVRCEVQGLTETGQGRGTTRRKAEQQAAQMLLEKIYDDDDD